MVGEPDETVSLQDYSQYEPWSAKAVSKSNTKTKSPWGREKQSLGSYALVCLKSHLEGDM
jgi:hypothetical protein